MNCDKHEILQEPLTELTTLVDIDSTQLSPIAVKSMTVLFSIITKLLILTTVLELRHVHYSFVLIY